MRACLVLGVLAVLAGIFTQDSPAAAGVLVFDNHTAARIDFTIRPPEGKETRHAVAAGDVAAIPVSGPVEIRYWDGEPSHHVLQPNNAFYFVSGEKPVELVQLGLPVLEGGNFRAVRPAPSRPGQPPPASPDAVSTIPIKILADDQEPRVQEVWEKRIRKRLAEASEIFEHHCRVRFQVVAVGSWTSDPKNFMFDKALADFEQRVQPAPARLAIGFTGRWQWLPGERHAGGTRTPLHPFILVREAFPQVSEAERLEFLVHELGHYLGAAHSADSASVMRPKLGDRQARARSFRIRFDAPNTLIMNLVVENLRARPTWNLCQLSPETKAPVAACYLLLLKAMPGEPSTIKDLALLGIDGMATLRRQEAARPASPPFPPRATDRRGSSGPLFPQ